MLIMNFKHLLTLGMIATTSVATFAQSDTLKGNLTSTDLQREGSEYYDVHQIEVDSPRMIRVWLNSEEFDAYLVIKTPYGTEEVNDDMEGSDSYIEILADEPGTYTVWASAYEGGSTGSYQLVIDIAEEVNIERIEGRLDPRDERLPKGEYVDTYTREISADEAFSVRLRAYGFDGYLVVTSPSGQTFRNDDYDSDYTISMLTGLQPEKGKWKIQVTTLNIDEVGAYDLEIITKE